MNNVVQSVPVPGSSTSVSQKVVNPTALELWIDDTDKELQSIRESLAEIQERLSPPTANMANPDAPTEDRVATRVKNALLVFSDILSDTPCSLHRMTDGRFRANMLREVKELIGLISNE